MKRTAAILAVLAVLAVLSGCGGKKVEKGPILLITIDTLRSDHLPAYGYGKIQTPAIDGLAKDAILFERAYSHYPLTLPSHVSILTGELPPVHGIRDNVGYLFESSKHPYLPRLLKQAGYETGAAISAFVLRPETGLAEGFDSYEGDIKAELGQSLDSVIRSGAETLQRALPWIRERAAKPFFFFFHIYEPHTPYEPTYEADIVTADKVIGDLLAELKRLGIYDRATIVLLSDHGEGLGDHGEKQHGIFLYRETLQVPLMIKLPGAERGGERISTPAQLVDVTPTLLSLAGVEVPEGLTGSSLLDLPDEPRRIYSETFYARIHYGWSDLASLVEDRFHYIEAPESELYDLAADPGEKRNVLAAERRTYSALRQAMREHDRRLVPPAAADEETAAKLAALGYIGSSMAEHQGPLPDPKTQRHILADMEEGLVASTEGRHAEAAALFERLLAANPNMQDVWAFYANSLQKLGRDQEAVDAYEKALKLSGGSPQLALATGAKLMELRRFDAARSHAELALKNFPKRSYELLSQIALKEGKEDEALAVMRRAVAEGEATEALRRQLALVLSRRGQPAEAVALLQPLAQSAELPTLNTLAIALSDSGRHAEANAVLQQALQKDPKNAHIHETLGMVALRLSNPQEARGHLRRALELDDKLPVAWNTLGVALYQTEGPAAAVEAWKRSVALDPKQYDALYNLGLVAAQVGQRAEARKALRQFVDTAPPQRFAADIQKAQGILREIGG
jgi:tetratricopeptide (TPR) repeat protein